MNASRTPDLRGRRTRRRAAWRHLQGLIRPRSAQYALEDIHGLQDFIDRRSFERMGRRLAETGGASLIGEDLHLDDPELLARLGELGPQTLGGAFARFMQRHGLSLNVTEPGPFPATRPAEYAKLRHRETHDLVHVLLGLGVSPRDEVLVQAFTAAQNPRWLSLGVIIGGLAKHARLAGDPALIGDVAHAYWAGRSAQYLLALRFEKLWEEDLTMLRARLGVQLLGDEQAQLQ